MERFHELFGSLRSTLRRNAITELIRGVPLFGDLDEVQTQELVEKVGTASIAEGGSVFSQGEEGSIMYIVSSGSVKVTRRLENDEIVTVKDAMGPGSYFGETAIMKAQVRSATVTVTSPMAELLTISLEDFRALMGSWLSD